jgi:hypothetical protein
VFGEINVTRAAGPKELLQLIVAYSAGRLDFLAENFNSMGAINRYGCGHSHPCSGVFVLPRS